MPREGRSLPRAVRRSAAFWAVGAWIVAGGALAFFERPLWDAIWILTLGLWALYAVVGFVLFGVMAWRGWRRGRLRGALLGGGAMVLLEVALALGLPYVSAAGDQFQFARRFARMKPQYEAIVARVVAAPEPRGGEASGIVFEVDAGPPRRVAFPQPGGITDNWEGVVWDPTGVVRSATGWRHGIAGDYTATAEARRLFGGDLVACRHIADHFYRCWFT